MPRRLCVARGGCDRAEANYGFCREHTPTNEHDVAFYRLRYKRLIAKLRQGRVTLAEYHNRALTACALRAK